MQHVEIPFEVETHSYRWIVLGGVWLLYFSFGLIAAGMAPIVQPISAELGLDYAQMGFIMGAWPLLYIVSAIPCGTLLDRIGPGRALLIGIAFIAASGALRGAATGEYSLFLAVAVFGMGGPIISVGAPKLVSLWFASAERGLAMGIYMTGASLGAVSGVALTNSVFLPLMNGDWRAVMFCYAGFAIACGAVWLLVNLNLTCRSVEGRCEQVTQASSFENVTALLRLPSLRLVLLLGMGIFFFNQALGNWLPEILRSRGMAPAEAGFWAAVPTAIGIIAALTIPRFATGSRRIPILALVFLSAAGATLLLRADPGPILLSGLILQGIARGAMTTTTMLLLIELPGIDSRKTGLAGGMFFSAAEIGGVLGPATIGYVSHATGGFSMPLFLMTVDATVMLVLLFLLMGTMRRTAIRL
ncbi:MAG: MFS transporter [Alphaproteobacteria bacterium]